MPRLMFMRVLAVCLFALVLISAGTLTILAPLRAADDVYSAGVAPGASKGWPELLGVLNSREIVIDSPRLTINLPEKGGVAKVTISSGPSLTPLIAMIEKLAFKTVRLKNGTFVFRTPSGFTQTIYGVNATISGDKNSAITTAKGRFKFRGEEVSFDISSVNKSAGPDKGSVPVSIILKGGKINAQLAGSFGLGEGFELEGKLQLSLPDLKFVSAWLGYPLAKAVKFGELRANGAFSWKGSLLSFADATFSSGGNQAMGTFSVDLAGARPRIDGTLALENIDIKEQIFGRIFGSLAGQQSYSLSSGQAEGSSSSVVENYMQNTSLDLDYLSDFDAYIRLSADQVKLGSLNAEDCAFTLTLKSGDLFFGLVESKLAGGLAHGEIDLKTIKGVRRSNLRVNLENVEIDRIIGAFNWKSPFKGIGHLKVDLAGHGENLNAHIKTLSGEVSLKTLDGVDFAIDMKNFIHEESEVEKLTWWTGLLTSSRFKEFNADFVFKNGLAISRSMLINGSDFGVTASGSINIPAKRFYFSFQRVASSESGNQDEAEFKDSSVNAIVVHGPWKALRIAVGGSIGAKDASTGDETASDQISKDGELPLEEPLDPGRG